MYSAPLMFRTDRSAEGEQLKGDGKVFTYYPLLFRVNLFKLFPVLALESCSEV